MNRDGLPTRHQESPLTRRNRDIPPSTNNCLEVQWRFLQHKNPKPPQFGSPSRKPLLIDPLKPERFVKNDAKASSRQPEITHPAPRGSPSRLFQMFETQEVDSGDGNTTITRQTAPQLENSLPESPRASRTLNDLMGETQRQAMLDRILADMEYLAVEPTYSRLGQNEGDKVSSPRKGQRARSHKPSILHTALRNDSNSSKQQVQPKQRRFSVLWSLASQGDYADDMDDLDDDDDLDFDGSQPDRDDSKRRQRLKLRQFVKVDEAPRIFWQKTDGARSAADVPERLLTLSPSPPRRMRSAHIVLGRRSRTPRQLLSPSTTIDNRVRLMGGSTSPQPSRQVTSTARSSAIPKRKLRLPGATSPVHSDKPPASPPKARYGSWYVPQSEWWALHQIEQQTIEDKDPASAIGTDEPHCHGGNTSPTQRQHKPPLPPAALSPRGHDSSQAKVPVAVSTGTGRLSSASSRPPPSAPGPLELQVASIPQSYIGREYRAFIISTGSAMPQYLQ